VAVSNTLIYGALKHCDTSYCHTSYVMPRGQGDGDSVQGPGGASAVVAASQAYSGLP